jgi:hypothetical protein
LLPKSKKVIDRD